MRRAGWWVLALAALGAGCDDGGGSDGAGGSGGGTGPLAGDTYVAGLTHMGAAGALEVRLMEATPAPPELGDNTWQVAIVDAAGAPQAGCTVEPSPRMPAHGHGTNTPAVVRELGEGSYEITPLDLFMPGLWEVPLHLVCGDAEDEVLFAFWIEG
ncbi:MAG: FixH family protein [Myxococcales bacterium]|nr:FixH family protein [Myxococcales bacterium]MCB9546397.1 FixH family protein [Myxococcales bacterium]